MREICGQIARARNNPWRRKGVESRTREGRGSRWKKRKEEEEEEEETKDLHDEMTKATKRTRLATRLLGVSGSCR